MAGGDVRHSAARPGRGLRRAGAGLVAVVLVLAALSHFFDLGPRWLGWDAPSPQTAPAEVPPPPGLDLPEPVPAVAVAESTPAGRADAAKVRRAIARLLRDEDLGRRVAVEVRELSAGEPVHDSGPDLVTPASTMKLLTSVAALEALGPEHTFSTTTVAGASPRQVVLVGGGDPLLGRAPDSESYPARADIVTLGKATARALRLAGRTRVRLAYDTSLFSGPAVSPHWPASYVVDDVVSRISPLWVDEGRERPGLVFRAEDPALEVANELARVLGRLGVEVVGRPEAAPAPPDAVEYASVRSAPLAQIVQWVLETSDNEAAEVLFRHVALAEGEPGSFEGASTAVSAVLTRLGVDTSTARILDGSGLSRANRLAPGTLLGVLDVAGSDPHLRTVVTTLPVAGFTGSLTYRFATDDDIGLGRVRAKTGTLTGVHGLAGVVTSRDGVVLSFVAVADKVRPVDTLDAREALDDIAAALADCVCAAS